jgi:hypothetical protein
MTVVDIYFPNTFFLMSRSALRSFNSNNTSTVKSVTVIARSTVSTALDWPNTGGMDVCMYVRVSVLRADPSSNLWTWAIRSLLLTKIINRKESALRSAVLSSADFKAMYSKDTALHVEISLLPFRSMYTILKNVISGSHSGENEHGCLLGCCSV